MFRSPEYLADLERFPARKGRTFHHFSYRHLKRHGSIYWVHGLYIPKWLHVPVLHLVLGWGAHAGSQRLGKFPNPAQRAAHWILRLVALLAMPFDKRVPMMVRLAATVVLGVAGAIVVDFVGSR